MATVTGVTAARAADIEKRLITTAKREGSSLVFTRFDGEVLSLDNVFPALYESYPIGSIYISVNSANPATYMGGGTWARWGNGRTIVGVDESDGLPTMFTKAENTGGSKTHTLSIGEMPSHNHPNNEGVNWTTGATHDHYHTGSTSYDGDHAHAYEYPGTSRGVAAGSLGAWNSYRSGANTSVAGGHTHSFATNGMSQSHYHGIFSQGGNQAHNNVQPYIVAYFWKRTA